MDAEWIRSLLLDGLLDKYSPMIMAIEHSGIAISADFIKMKLLDMEPVDGSGGSSGCVFAGRGAGNAGNFGRYRSNTTNGQAAARR
ncbi:hypothetical protein HHI36_024094 [Cryptolaemus montrouzieri]|uniref:Uncharacterized protein n=1 Tax=Cryptolaemus montrouzieri TaxID=559131 RepID=A0ABD2PIN8_9CUCU